MESEIDLATIPTKNTDNTEELNSTSSSEEESSSSPERNQLSKSVYFGSEKPAFLMNTLAYATAGRTRVASYDDEIRVKKKNEQQKPKTKEEFINYNRENGISFPRSNKNLECAVKKLEMSFRKETFDEETLQILNDTGTNDVLPKLETKPSIFSKVCTARDLSHSLLPTDFTEKPAKFSVKDWARFQLVLKDHYHLIKSEIAPREKHIKNITRISQELGSLYLQIREHNDNIQQILRNEESADNSRYMLDEENTGLRDCYANVKKFVFSVFEDPKIITLIEMQETGSKLKAIEETLCHGYHENLLNEDNNQQWIVWLAAELLKAELEKMDNPAELDVFFVNSRFERIMMQYLKRPECQKFAKAILKDALKTIIKDNTLIRTDLKQIIEITAKQKPNTLKSASLLKTEPNGSGREEHDIVRRTQSNFMDLQASGEFDIFRQQRTTTVNKDPTSMNMSQLQTGLLVSPNDDNALSLGLHHIIEEDETIHIPVFVPKALAQHFEHESTPNSKETNEGIKKSLTSESVFELNVNDYSFDTESENSKPPMQTTNPQVKKGSDVSKILHESMIRLRNICNALIDNLFEKIYHAPNSIRNICRVLVDILKQKFPKLQKKELQAIVGKFFFARWLLPQFTSPDRQGILRDFDRNQIVMHNIKEASKLLKRIFFQDYYNKDDPLCELNYYIYNLAPSIECFYNELIDVNEKELSAILSGKHLSDNNRKIRLRSVCLSIKEIEVLLESVNRCGEAVGVLNQSVTQLAQEITDSNKEAPLFGDRAHPTTQKQIPASKSYVNFYDLLFPPELAGNYIEEFNRIKNFHKDMSEHDKLLVKSRFLLKQILIHIESLTDLSQLSTSPDLNIEEVLENYQHKLFVSETKLNFIRARTNLDVSARLLLIWLKKLDPQYRVNNYEKIYNDMVAEFKGSIFQLSQNIFEAKLQLMNGVEKMRRSYQESRKLNDKKKRMIKLSLVKEFINSVCLPLCVTNAAARQEIFDEIPKSSEPLDKKLMNKGQKILIVPQEDCVHKLSPQNPNLNGGKKQQAMSTMSFNQKNLTSSLNSALIKGVRREVAFERTESVASQDSISRSHFTTVNEFIKAFAKIPEVRDYIIKGTPNQIDTFEVNKAFTNYLECVLESAKKKLKNLAEQEYEMIIEEIESYATRRIFPRVYPLRETPKDQAFWLKVKTIEWLTYDHLEIPEKYRLSDMWNHAIEILLQVDNKLTPLGKIDCMIECFSYIVQVCGLSKSEGSTVGADEAFPLLVYILIKAAPKRIHSNINFITAFRHSSKMFSEKGLCLTHFRSAIGYIESINHTKLKVSEKEYNRLVREAEVKFQRKLLRTCGEGLTNV